LGAKIASPTREMTIKRALLQLFVAAEEPKKSAKGAAAS
jgi:hypothetical protein